MEHLTLYPPANTLLQALLGAARAVLGAELVGLYVHGSLASGDFAPARSDIDFVAVTRSQLPTERISALAAMHTRLAESNLEWVEKLEGSYIPQTSLRRYDPSDTRYPALRVDGSFHIDEHGPDWIIQRHILRETGLTLTGPPPQTLIDPVSPETLRQAARATLESWWAPMLADPSRLSSREYQAYAALTMCRSLYTLEHGAVTSKSSAARWAQATLNEPWAALIEQALVWPLPPQTDRLQETLAWIRFTLNRS